ncbi:MAG: 2-hydroxyacyl-CoA dehydratase, partial [Dictyoglomaceae bacterium]
MRYFAKELEGLYKELSEDSKIERLVDTIDFYNSLRDRVKKGGVEPLSVFSILTGKFYDHSERGKEFNFQLRIYLLSSMFPFNFIEFLEDLGLKVVYVDAYFGVNLLEEVKNYHKDPFYALSEY